MRPVSLTPGALGRYRASVVALPARVLLAVSALPGLVACGAAPGAASLTVAVPYEIETLDPHAKNSLSHFAVVSNFYDPLVTTDADLRIRPHLAQLWETPDPTTWVFHLRPGVVFADGRPLRARDVAWSIRRLQTEPGLEIATYALYIDELTPLDDRTLRLRTTRPVSILLNKLRFLLVVPEGSSRESLARRPNGSGPYVLEARQDRSLQLRRREDYWGRRPWARRVRLLLDRPADEAANLLIGGGADLAQCSSREAEGRVRAGGRFSVKKRPSLFVKQLGLDVGRRTSPFVKAERNPLQDVTVRRALSLAIDRNSLVAGLAQEAVPATQFVPPAIFGYNPALPLPAFDRAAARGLLQRAGFSSGFEATLHVRKLFGTAALLLRDQLAEVGVRLEVVVLDDPPFLERARRGEFSLLLSRLGCPTGDASDILDNALHSKDPARRYGLNNDGGYSNAELDRLIEESAGIDDVGERRNTLWRIMQILVQDLPWIPLYVDQDVYALAPGVAWEPRNDSFVLAAEIARR